MDSLIMRKIVFALYFVFDLINPNGVVSNRKAFEIKLHEELRNRWRFVSDDTTLARRSSLHFRNKQRNSHAIDNRTLTSCNGIGFSKMFYIQRQEFRANSKLLEFLRRNRFDDFEHVEAHSL